MKEQEIQDFHEFHKHFLKELENLGKSFQAKKEILSFKEFIEKYSEEAKLLLDVLNKDIKINCFNKIVLEYMNDKVVRRLQ